MSQEVKADLQIIKDMLKSKHISFTEHIEHKKEIMLTVERGYAGFATVFTFDLEGKFVDIGAFE